MGRAKAIDDADLQEVLALHDDFGVRQKDSAQMKNQVSSFFSKENAERPTGAKRLLNHSNRNPYILYFTEYWPDGSGCACGVAIVVLL